MGLHSGDFSMFRLFAVLIAAFALIIGSTSIIQAQEATPAMPTPVSVEQMIIPGFKAGQILLDEAFDEEDAWEYYENVYNDVSMGVIDGVYQVHDGSGGFIWGLNRDTHQDVVIQVQATLRSQDLADSYGIMCRADPANDGDGYYFLIGGDGSYSIAKGVGGENGTVDSLQSDMSYEINPGQDTNIIQVVCAGDYLGLYINGQYVMSTH